MLSVIPCWLCCWYNVTHESIPFVLIQIINSLITSRMAFYRDKSNLTMKVSKWKSLLFSSGSPLTVSIHIEHCPLSPYKYSRLYVKITIIIISRISYHQPVFCLWLDRGSLNWWCLWRVIWCSKASTSGNPTCMYFHWHTHELNIFFIMFNLLN